MFIVLCFFVKQKTAYEMRISDWSSDVCSSDLDACSVHIDIPIMASGVGLGDKRCIMMHNIHVAHGRCYAIAVKNAAIDERNVFRTRRIGPDVEQADIWADPSRPKEDRKSTRLNSSH